MTKSASYTDPFASQNLKGKLDRDQKRAVDARRKYAYGTTTGGPGSSRTRPTPASQYHLYVTGSNVLRSLKDDHSSHPRKHRDGSDTSDKVEAPRRGYYARRGHKVAAAAAAPKVADVFDLEAAGSRDEQLAEDFIYSYDHPRGPTSGSQVLGAALDQAVQRFENKVTEALVHDEYSVVDDTEQIPDPKELDTEQDEDFELV